MTTPTSSKILVGVDGSTTSANALRWATQLAKNTSGTITATMAWSYPTALLMPVVGAPVLPAEDLSEVTRATLEALVAATPDPDPVAEQWVIMGAPRSVLTESSEDQDVLVLGRTGRNRLQRAWLGSTASYCVRHAACPVVIIGESTAPESTITVAVDGSLSSIEALVWALGLGDDHDVLAVYSHDEWELDDLPLDDRIREDLDKKADELVARVVEAAIERTGADEDRIKRQVRQGDPRTTIVEQADPSELLVLGAQGHSGLARWFLGSLADYAVHHAPGSVAIWR